MHAPHLPLDGSDMKWTAKPVGDRNKLNGIMLYQIKCSLPGFFSARAWCWDAFGPGIEHEHYTNFLHVTGVPMPWCWDAAKFQGASIDHGRLYLSTDDQLTRFSERWK